MTVLNLFVVVVSSLVLVESFTPSFQTFTDRSKHLGTRQNLGVRRLACTSTLSELSDVNRRQFLGKVLLTTASFLAASQSVQAKPTKATAEETVDAWKNLIIARDLLKTADGLVEKKDWPSILDLLENDTFKNMETSLLKLVNGPILNQDDKKTIGTRKRYGIAADVLFGIGGVQSAIAALSDPQLQSCSAGVCSGKFVEADVEVPKSLKGLSASLNEILTICKSYKEFN
mmetsp:Transcript_47017/g.98452  ORF Transcript_47017/g.98452 Transcript_47017/m.98452 type:complete len:230 (-) Transcript_47017:111-800(-)